eukprot:Opistho-1_new@42074
MNIRFYFLVIVIIFGRSQLKAQSSEESKLASVAKFQLRDLELSLNSYIDSKSPQLKNQILQKYFSRVEIIEDDLFCDHPPALVREKKKDGYLSQLATRVVKLDFSDNIGKYYTCLDIENNNLFIVEASCKVQMKVINSSRTCSSKAYLRIFEFYVNKDGSLTIRKMLFSNSNFVTKCQTSPRDDKQYEAIKQEIMEKQKEIGTLRGKIGAFEIANNRLIIENQRIPGMRDSIMNLLKENKTLKERINKLQTEVNSLQVTNQELSDTIRLRREKDSIALARKLYAEAKLAEMRKIYASIEYKVNSLPADELKIAVDSIWSIINNYYSYMQPKDHLIQIELLKDNLSDVINRSSICRDSASQNKINCANERVLEGLASAISKGNNDEKSKAKYIVANLTEYVKIVRNGYSDIILELRRGLGYYQKKDYALALRIFSENFKYLSLDEIASDRELYYDILYAQGTILLWNLGNIDAYKGLVRKEGRVWRDITNRKQLGKEYLGKILSSKEEKARDLQLKANIAISKYYNHDEIKNK